MHDREQRANPADRARETTPADRRAGARVQAKLAVGAVDDPLEREADQIATEVVAAIQSFRAAAPPGAAGVAGASGPGANAAPGAPPSRVRARRAPTPAVGPEGGDLDDGVATRIRASSGRPLAAAVRAPMEQAFGADLSAVRVHADSTVAPELGASAFTLGHDIHFASGQYHPGDRAGLWLLGHELTHVVQQTGGAPPAAQRAAATTRIARAAMAEMASTVEVRPGPQGRSRVSVQQEGTELGSVEMAAAGAQTVEATDLAVAPSARKRGYGQQLLAAVATTAERAGRSRVTLGSGDDGSGKLDRWYHSLGFERTGTVDGGFSAFAAPTSALRRSPAPRVARRPARSTVAAVRRMQAPVKQEKFEIAPDEFGETYHAAAAILLGSGDIVPELALANADQKAFLLRILAAKKRWAVTEADYTNVASDKITKGDATGRAVLTLKPMKEAADKARARRDAFAEGTPERASAHEELKAATASLKGTLDWFADILVGHDDTPGGANPIQAAVHAYLGPKLAAIGMNDANPKAAIFYRNKAGAQAGGRNMGIGVLTEIFTKYRATRRFILVGSAVTPEITQLAAQHNCTVAQLDFFGDRAAAGLPTLDAYTFQLNIYRCLHQQFGVAAHLGMKSGAMDGPALIGVPTLFFDTAGTAEGRLGQLASVLPGMKRVPYQ